MHHAFVYILLHNRSSETFAILEICTQNVKEEAWEPFLVFLLFAVPKKYSRYFAVSTKNHYFCEVFS